MLAEASSVRKADGSSSLQHSESNFIYTVDGCHLQHVRWRFKLQMVLFLRAHTDCRIASGNNDKMAKSNVPLRCIRAHSTDRIGKRDKVSCPDGSTDSCSELVLAATPPKSKVDTQNSHI